MRSPRLNLLCRSPTKEPKNTYPFFFPLQKNTSPADILGERQRETSDSSP